MYFVSHHRAMQVHVNTKRELGLGQVEKFVATVEKNKKNHKKPTSAFICCCMKTCIQVSDLGPKKVFLLLFFSRSIASLRKLTTPPKLFPFSNSYHKHSKEAQMVACANNFTRSSVCFTAIRTPKTFMKKEKEKICINNKKKLIWKLCFFFFYPSPVPILNCESCQKTQVPSSV